MTEDVVSIEEAAKLVNRSRRTIHRWIALGKLSPVPSTSGRVQIAKADVFHAAHIIEGETA